MESCHPSDENNDGQQDNNEDENILHVIESSLICLTYLVRMRCVEGSNDSGTKRKAKKSSVAPMFGPEFVTTIATDLWRRSNWTMGPRLHRVAFLPRRLN